MMSEEYRRSSTSRNMKPLEVWTCQRAENLNKKSSKIPKIQKFQKITTQPTNYRRRRRADQQKSAAAPTNCRRRRGAAGARLYLKGRARASESSSRMKVCTLIQ